MAISKKIRFEVFKRDNFTCAYCGNTPPNIILELDHLVSKSEGGTDDINNLITSCFNCNRGKGKYPLEQLPSSLKDNLEVIKEQRKQMKLYNKYLEEITQQKEDDAEEIGHHFFNYFVKSKRSIDKYVFAGNYKANIKVFMKIFNKYQIMEAIDIAVARLDSKGRKTEINVFKYMCGILHNWRRAKNGEQGNKR